MIKRNILHYIALFLVFFFNSQRIKAQTDSNYLTNDGTWCWFSDPRAVMIDDQNIVLGWVKANGTIEAAKFNLLTKELNVSELYFQLEKDDHNNPAFIITTDGQILAMYTRHIKKDLFINRLTDPKNDFRFSEPQMIHPMSEDQISKFLRPTITYANPFRLENENNRIYCFGRWIGFKPNLMWSDDNGLNWTNSKVFITKYPNDTNNRPYVKYASNGKSRIHLVFTDGHPRDEPTNSVYYAYYENGAFYKVTGEKIATLQTIPFEQKDATYVYTSNEKNGRAWIADIGYDKNNYPIILYTRSPDETNHEYWYARYTKKGWVEYKICNSGKWFPQTPENKTEPEPHYFGGMSIHPNNPDVVYLSRQVNGVFEIERWETKNDGNSWEVKAITQNSKIDNVRPYVPIGLKAEAKEIVFWMENQKYIHYTNYKTSIKYHINQ